MRVLGAALAVIMFFGIQALDRPYVAADVAISANITVRATILPARSIIVDSSGQIIKIISNTTANVVPIAYKQTIDPRNLEPITPELEKSYQDIIQAHADKTIGILYPISALKLQQSPKFWQADFISTAIHLPRFSF